MAIANPNRDPAEAPWRVPDFPVARKPTYAIAADPEASRSAARKRGARRYRCLAVYPPAGRAGDR